MVHPTPRPAAGGRDGVPSIDTDSGPRPRPAEFRSGLGLTAGRAGTGLGVLVALAVAGCGGAQSAGFSPGPAPGALAGAGVAPRTAPARADGIDATSERIRELAARDLTAADAASVALTRLEELKARAGRPLADPSDADRGLRSAGSSEPAPVPTSTPAAPANIRFNQPESEPAAEGRSAAPADLDLARAIDAPSLEARGRRTPRAAAIDAARTDRPSGSGSGASGAAAAAADTPASTPWTDRVFPHATDERSADLPVDPPGTDHRRLATGLDPVQTTRVAFRTALLNRAIDEGVDGLDKVIALAFTLMDDPGATLDEVALRRVDEDDQPVVAALTEFGQAVGASARDGLDREVLLAAIDALRDEIAQAPMLNLPVVTLCLSVEDFGRFEPIRSRRFHAGRAHQVIVYVEVEDFGSEQDESGQWHTELEQRVVIYDERDRRPVWTDEWREVHDVTNKRRRDFFLAQILELPAALPLGRYRMKVQVRDRQTRAEAEASIDFETTAGGVAYSDP